MISTKVCAGAAGRRRSQKEREKPVETKKTAPDGVPFLIMWLKENDQKSHQDAYNGGEGG